MPKYKRIESEGLISDDKRRCKCSVTKSLIAFVIAVLIIAMLLYFRASTILGNDKTESIDVIYNATFFLINPVHLCQASAKAKGKEEENDDGLKIKLLILISSFPKNIQFRQAIRDTWGSLIRRPKAPIRLAFVVGTSPMNHTLTKLIRSESQATKDIIQPDLADNKQNQTSKSSALLLWAADYCPNAEFVLKSDDNTFVDVGLLLSILSNDERYKNETEFISGYVSEKKDHEIGVDNASKEYMLPHSSRSTFVIGHNAVQPLYHLSVSSGIGFPFDDDFLHSSGIHVLPDNRLAKHPPPQDWPSFKGTVASCGYDPYGIRSLWQQLVEEAIYNFIVSDSCSRERNLGLNV